ncbi:MAG: hypothetical protein MUO23_05765 [Anaerolineales bacterium]|nr:hypothetical protein [Anaerolineales bacterium]
MGRKILYGTLIVVSGLLMVLSVMGIGAAWAYNEPLTQQGLSRLGELDRELGQAQTALGNAGGELARALRILEGAETTLAALSQNTTQAQQTLQGVGEALDGRLIPGLKTASEKIDQVRVGLQGVLTTLKTINSVPFLNISIPGEELLTGLLDAADTLDAEIANVEEVADKASTFLADVEYVLGGDLSETRQSIEQLLTVVTEYEAKIEGWRAQIAGIQAGLAGWVDQACIGLTLLLLWFGLSQFGLILHGLTGWKGGNPLAALRMGASGGGQ